MVSHGEMGRTFKIGFTLIEILVVIAIIAVLAALLFPVFSRAKEASKKTSCLSNIRQIGSAVSLYVNDADGRYPKTKRQSDHPEVDDADGALDEPYYGSFFALIYPYTGAPGKVVNDDVSRQNLYACPTDSDAFGASCSVIAPDAPALTSYLVNAFFVFGRGESDVDKPSSTILLTERRSSATQSFAAYCDDLYHPWFNSANPQAPNNDMASDGGAVATTRHSGLSNYAFADLHCKAMAWTQTFSPPFLDLHQVHQP